MKKSQAWGMDIMVAFMIFSVGLMVFYVYTLNKPDEAKENFELLTYDGKLITNSLFTEGYPQDWPKDTVPATFATPLIRIGIFTEDRINNTKLKRFYNITQTGSDYNKTKDLFNTNYDYYFFLDSNMTTIAANVDGIGKPGIDRKSRPGKNLVKITRFLIYENKTTTAYLHIWED